MCRSAWLDKKLGPLISAFRTDSLGKWLSLPKTGLLQEQLEAASTHGKPWEQFYFCPKCPMRTNWRITEISGDQSHYTICGKSRRMVGLGRGLSHPDLLLSPQMLTSKAGRWDSVRWWSSLTHSAARGHEKSRILHTRGVGQISSPRLLGHIHWGQTSKGKEIKTTELYNIGCWMIFKGGRLSCLFVWWNFFL